MLYIIGLGLNKKGISLEGKEAVKKCKKVYLENYTVKFPYSVKELRKVIGKKIFEAGREDIESDKLIKEAEKKNVGLLIYGSPLFATTHEGLVLDCAKARVKVEIAYSASIFDALGETGLQLYKFGKISSMPKWEKGFEPDSFLEYVKENQSVGAHSLILVDIGLSFKDALDQLKKACKRRNIKIDNILVCSRMGGDNSKIFYDGILNLKKKKIFEPFCFIIPGKMHFIEKQAIEGFS